MMKRTLLATCIGGLALTMQAQTYETKFARPLGEVLNEISARFNVRLKYDVDTVGKVLPYADFRIRSYSVEESLNNVLAPFDFKVVKQGNSAVLVFFKNCTIVTPLDAHSPLMPGVRGGSSSPGSC